MVNGGMGIKNPLLTHSRLTTELTAQELGKCIHSFFLSHKWYSVKIAKCATVGNLVTYRWFPCTIYKEGAAVCICNKVAKLIVRKLKRKM